MAKEKNKNSKKTDKSFSFNSDSELDKFYGSIIQEINKNIEEKNFKKAMELISDELDAPYIPSKYENVFLDLTKKVRILDFESKEMELAKKSLPELIDVVNNDLSNNFETYSFILDKYHEKLSKQEWHRLNQIFVSEKNSNVSKLSALFFLSQLSEMQNKKITYYNNCTNYFNDIFVHKNLIHDYELKFADIFNHLEKIFYKNPSKYEHAIFISDLLTSYFFPTDIPWDSFILSKGIINYIECSYSEIRNYRDFLESLDMSEDEVEKNIEIFGVITNMLSNVDNVEDVNVNTLKLGKRRNNE